MSIELPENLIHVKKKFLLEQMPGHGGFGSLLICSEVPTVTGGDELGSRMKADFDSGRPGSRCGSMIDPLHHFRQALYNANMDGSPYGQVSERIHSFENAVRLEMHVISLLGVGGGWEEGKAGYGFCSMRKIFHETHFFSFILYFSKHLFYIPKNKNCFANVFLYYS